MIPLIDVMMVLLAIFLVTAPRLTRHVAGVVADASRAGLTRIGVVTLPETQ